MSEGWIKLHRKMNDWEWKDTPNTFCLFIHLLLNANHKNKRHKGVMVKKGQIKTGRKLLALQTGLSEREVRTSLEHLRESKEIAIQPTNNFSIITMVNWEKYQATDQPIDQVPTNERPSTDQVSTTNKNDNNDKNVKKGNRGSRLPDDWTATDDYINFALKEGLTIDAANREADKFKDYWHSATKNAVKKDWLATWRNWIRNNKDYNKNAKSNNKSSVENFIEGFSGRNIEDFGGMG